MDGSWHEADADIAMQGKAEARRKRRCPASAQEAWSEAWVGQEKLRRVKKPWLAAKHDGRAGRSARANGVLGVRGGCVAWR
jgi:hypothetical protein